MAADNTIDSVFVRLTEFGASLGHVQVQEGMFSFDFQPGEIKEIDRLMGWEKILKQQVQGGRPLFELVTQRALEDRQSSECSLCGGTGWKATETPGKEKRVTRCDCQIKERSVRLLKAAGIPRGYKKCTLANFDTNFPGATASVVNARLYAGRFVEEYPNYKRGLLLIGPAGVGKTHLVVGIIRELIESKVMPCLFCDYRELLKQIQNSYNPQVQATELELLRPVFEAEVLVLDELGAIRPSEWVWDTVSHIINYRYSENKTTIVTSNYANRSTEEEDARLKKEIAESQKRNKNHVSREEIEAAGKAQAPGVLGERITNGMLSRLRQMCRVIEVDGLDFRTRNSRP
jgi:DNA replication protein DnaC